MRKVMQSRTFLSVHVEAFNVPVTSQNASSVEEPIEVTSTKNNLNTFFLSVPQEENDYAHISTVYCFFQTASDGSYDQIYIIQPLFETQRRIGTSSGKTRNENKHVFQEVNLPMCFVSYSMIYNFKRRQLGDPRKTQVGLSEDRQTSH